MKTTGSCFCGALAFEAEVDPKKVVVCYCTDCQISSGGTCHVNTIVPEADFKMTKGEPAHFIKTADSGNKRNIGFCGTCGTQLYAVNAEGPKVYGVRVPTLHQRDQLRPVMRFFLRSKPDWVATEAELPGHQAM
jgi:hypothetical protein